MAGYDFKDKLTIPADQAIAWQKSIYRAAGMSDADALTVADNLVTADLRGVYSHGIMRTPVYMKHFAEKNVDPTARPEILRRAPATALVDGKNGMGMVVADFATKLAIDMARESGSAAVSITGSKHLGTCAHYAEMAADAGMIGMFWSLSAANNMAPWGGVEALLSNNPVAIAVPCGTKPNVVMDMASSIVAKGKIMMAAKTGSSIPGDWALDQNGKPTTDPKAVLDGGTLAPLGGHKGVALSILIAAVTSVLNSSNYGPNLVGMYSGTNAHLNSGHLVQVIDIASITELDAFKQRMDEYVDYIKNGKKADGVDELFVPGEPEQRTKQRQLAEGIAYPASVIDEIRAVADTLGVKTPF